MDKQASHNHSLFLDGFRRLFAAEPPRPKRRGRASALEMTLAHLKAPQETATDIDKRYAWKLRLVKSLYRCGYERQEILELFRFIDWLLALPEELEERLWN